VLTALQNVLGVNEVLVGVAINDKHLQDWSGKRGEMPMALLLPRSTDEISKALAVYHTHQWPVVPQGGLTGLAGGAVVISLERMSDVEEVDSASATITVLAGTPLQVAQEAAHEAGFFLALDLGARGSCQVGGNIATNAGGNRVIRYGMARDLVLGLEVVLADVTVLSMMNKMFKNNAGSDLKGLFIGTEGTVGIITRAVLRLHGGVTGAHTALIALSALDEVVKLMRYAQKRLSGLVSAYEVMWADYYRSATTTVKGIRVPLAVDYPVYVLMDMQSAEPEENTERFNSVLEHAMEEGWVLDAVIAQSHSDAEDFWALRDSIAEMLNSYAPTINFDVSFPISKIGECVERLRRVMVDEFPDIHAMYFGHVGDGNLHIVVGPLPDDNQQTERALEDAFYDITRDLGGSVSAEHGIGTHKKPYLAHSRNRAEINLIKRMKQALDPQGILNPGKIID